MARYVKSNKLGIKDVDRNESWDYVMLDRNEIAQHNRLLQENKALKAEKEKHFYAAIDARQSASAEREEHKSEVKELEKQIADLRADLECQTRLNENLLRICKERANADRKLRPKKEHNGYVLLSRKLVDKKYQVTFQSPYDAIMDRSSAYELIRQDVLDILAPIYGIDDDTVKINNDKVIANHRQGFYEFTLVLNEDISIKN